MGSIVVIGGEAECAGFRLAGVEVVDVGAAAPGEVATTLTAALDRAALVVLTRAVAATLPAGVLQRAQAQGRVPVAVMPELTTPAADIGIARRMRAVLGIEA